VWKITDAQYVSTAPTLMLFRLLAKQIIFGINNDIRWSDYITQEVLQRVAKTILPFCE